MVRTPREVQWMGTTYRFSLTGEDAQRALGAWESVVPASAGPPRHVHEREDETFFIQSGEVQFWMQARSVELGPGESLFIRRGAEHTFRVLGERPARMLTVVTPGGLESFFVDMAEKNLRIPDDMAEVVAIAARYGVTFTGPPL